MIEARFDDLSGGGTSFRLTGPVGVVEATRIDEVAGTIAAADAAAARGLWVAGFVAYEAAPGLDPSLAVRPRDPSDAFAGLPLAWFAMFERREDTVLPEPQRDPEPGAGGAWAPSVDRAAYDDAIAAIRGHIEAGDTYQVNHTLRLRSRVEGDERGLYRDLCYAQRGAYAAYLNLGRYRVLSASPELFFELRDGRLTTRPMKGTARRGRWAAEDEAVAAALRGSVKDRAENAMIVDLLRNDMGRVAEPGVGVVGRRVRVRALRDRVAAHLHRVGDRRARAPACSTCSRALFPCGSVTGAPKVRTMQIIAGSGGLAARRLLRRGGLPRTPRQRVARGVLQRSHPHGDGGHADPTRPSSAWAAGITWDSRADGRVRRDGGQGEGAHRAPAALRVVRDDAPRPRRGVPPSRPPPRPHRGVRRLLRVRLRREGDRGGAGA